MSEPGPLSAVNVKQSIPSQPEMDLDTSLAATALLTEHLQYTPLSLIDDIINAVNTYVYQAITSLETGLNSAPPERLGFKPSLPTATERGGAPADATPDYVEAKKEIEEGLHKLETLLESTVDKNFDKLEIYVLRNILSVPEDLANWIQLGHYEGLNFPPPADTPSASSIDLLRRKLAESRKLNHLLLREKARTELLKGQLLALIGADRHNPTSPSTSSPSLAFLHSDTSSSPLTTSTSFALAQLPALKSALAELRPRFATLQSQTAQARAETAKDEQKQERREYIEQRTKAQLEKIGYRRPEDAAAIQGGKSVEKEELDALERAAGLLGGDMRQ